MPVVFTTTAVAQLRTAIHDQRGRVDGVRAQDPIGEYAYPQTYFIRIPVGGIPARTGLYLGQAVCELFMAPKILPVISEVRTLTPCLLPDGSRRQITVSNL